MKKFKNLVALVALIALVGCNGGGQTSSESSSASVDSSPSSVVESSDVESSVVESSSEESSSVPTIEFNDFTAFGRTSNVVGSVKKDLDGYTFKFVTDFEELSEETVVELYISVGTSFALAEDDVVIAVDGTGLVGVHNFPNGEKTEKVADGVSATWEVEDEKNVALVVVAYDVLGTEVEDVIGLAFKANDATSSINVDKEAGDTPAVEATHPDHALNRTFVANVNNLTTYLRLDKVGNVYFSYANDGQLDYVMLNDNYHLYDTFAHKDEDGLTFEFIANFSTNGENSEGEPYLEYINLLVDLDDVQSSGWTIGLTDLDFRLYSDGDIYYISGADTASEVSNPSSIWWHNPVKNPDPHTSNNASIAQKLEQDAFDDLSSYTIEDLGGGFKKITFVISYDLIYELSEANCDVDLDMGYIITQGRDAFGADTHNYNSWLYGSVFADGKWIGSLQDTAAQADYTVILEK